MHPARPVPALCTLTLVAAALAGPAAQDPLRLPAPAFPAALDEYHAGRPGAAITALDRAAAAATGDRALAARLLRARLLSEARRPADAAAVWRAIAHDEPSLELFAERRAIEDLLLADDLEAADSALEALAGPRPNRDHTDLLLALATSYRTRKAYDRAIDIYSEVLRIERTSSRGDAALLGLATALEEKGDVEAALAAYRRAEVEDRGADTFLEAQAAAARLASRTGTALLPLAARDAGAVAARLRAAARFAQALALIDDVRDGASPDDAEALDFERVTNLYLARQNDAARARAEQFLSDYPASAASSAVRLTLLRLAVREGDTARARALGFDLWRNRALGLSTTERESAARLLAAHLVSVGELVDGLELYGELAGTARTAASRIDTLWRSGAAAVRAGQLVRARSDLRRALALRPGPDTSAVIRYWLAVAEQDLGNRREGERLFRQLADESPYGYYGLLAARRLGASARTAAAAPATFPALALGARARRHPSFRAASLLASAGLADEAAAVVRQLAQALPSDKGLQLLAARASDTAGDHRRAVSLVVTHFGRYLDRPLRGAPPDLFALAYPRAYWEVMEPAAREREVDPLLLLALMRQESAFDPRARSAAGALGLLQLTPATAKAVAGRAGLDQLDEEMLLRPGPNSRVAAALVRELLLQFDGALSPVAASFNAGEDRVSAWWQAAKGLSEDSFVDSIPYSETRRYTRQVLENYSMYQRLYGTPSTR